MTATFVVGRASLWVCVLDTCWEMDTQATGLVLRVLACFSMTEARGTQCKANAPGILGCYPKIHLPALLVLAGSVA